jgi:hypothetical protein
MRDGLLPSRQSPHQHPSFAKSRFMRLPPVEEEIRRIVRDARAKNPAQSHLRKAVLEKRFCRGFSQP